MKHLQAISFFVLLILCAGGAESIMDNHGIIQAVVVFLGICAALAWSTWEVQR